VRDGLKQRTIQQRNLVLHNGFATGGKFIGRVSDNQSKKQQLLSMPDCLNRPDSPVLPFSKKAHKTELRRGEGGILTRVNCILAAILFLAHAQVLSLGGLLSSQHGGILGIICATLCLESNQ